MPIACLSELMKRPRARAGVASLVPIMDKQKSGGGFYQTRRMSFTDLKFAVENDEKESRCP